MSSDSIARASNRRSIDRSEAGWMLFARLLVWATRNNHRP